MKVYMIVYENHTLEPLANEEFHLDLDTQLIYVFQNGIPTEIINVRYTVSLTLTPPRELERCICEDTPNPECKAHYASYDETGTA